MWLYVDVYLLQNVIINAFTLFISLHLMGIKKNLWRILLGSAVGAGYALAAVINNSFLIKSMGIKYAIAFLMIRIVTSNKNFIVYCQTVLSFFIVTSVISGLLTLISPQTASGLIVQNYFTVSNISLWSFIMLIPLLVLILWFYKHHFTFRDWKSSTSILVQATIGNQELKIKTVLDTGNSLQEMFTKVPVIVVNKNVLMEQGLNSLYQIACRISDYQLLLPEELAIWQTYGKIIPFQAIGTDFSVLPALQPDQISYQVGNKAYDGVPALIALAPKGFFYDQEIQGLLHPAVYKAIMTEVREG